MDNHAVENEQARLTEPCVRKHGELVPTVKNILAAWRELITLAAFSALITTPSDINAMLMALPGSLLCIAAAYGLAVWRQSAV